MEVESALAELRTALGHVQEGRRITPRTLYRMLLAVAADLAILFVETVLWREFTDRPELLDAGAPLAPLAHLARELLRKGPAGSDSAHIDNFDDAITMLLEEHHGRPGLASFLLMEATIQLFVSAVWARVRRTTLGDVDRYVGSAMVSTSPAWMMMAVLQKFVFGHSLLHSALGTLAAAACFIVIWTGLLWAKDILLSEPTSRSRTRDH